MGLNILVLLIFILVLVLVLVLCIVNRFNNIGKECQGGKECHFSELYSSKTNTIETLVTMNIKLPHITKDIHISPTINKNANLETFEKVWAIPFHKYVNPLPSDIKNKFWAFYPLTHFQSFIFKKPLQLNEYHLKVIEQNPQFKEIIQELLNKDLFTFPCINIGIFAKYKQFSAPKLRYLQIGKQNNNDNELLALYRKSHISIKDTYEYIYINSEKLNELNDIHGIFNIVYFDLMGADDYVYSAHILYKTLFYFLRIINVTSLVIIQVANYNSQFMVDIITILQYIFKSVHIVRTIMNLDIYQTRSIICEHFDIIKFEKILSQLHTLDKDYTLFVKLLKDQQDHKITSSLKILTDISETIGNNRLSHIKKMEQLMYFVYSEEKNEIDLNKLKTIQDSEKLKAINFLSLLKIKPTFSLLFSIKDVENFMNYDYPLSIKISNIEFDITNLKYENIYQSFIFLESEFFLHKAYLHRVEWKKFKILDFLFRRTKVLKQIIRNKKLVHKSWLLSQAYFKMLEILHETNLCGAHITHIRAFHICEAPGQFIKSCQKYVEIMNKRGTKLSYDWNAQSLRATDQNTALDDVYGFLSDPQMKDKWLYGADHTGDITSYENILNYEQISKNSGYNMITSDCGIQFSIYEFQEEEIEYINYSQFITMLLCLQKGGSCAMKVFLPLARPMSLYMGHLLFEYFETVIYFKPSLNLTSSEIYLIGKGYKTIPDSVRGHILALHKNKMNLKDILPNLHNDNHYLINIKKHYESCNKLVFNSISCINKYLFFYNYMDEINKNRGESIEKKLKSGLYHVSEKWIKKYFM